MKTKKMLTMVLILAIIVTGVATVSFAATTFKTPAEIVADITDRNIEDVTADRQAGKSYGVQAQDADKFEEFKAARLEQYKNRLDELVADGTLTSDEAKERLEVMTERMETCDGTGIGNGAGNGTGANGGVCNGTGAGQGIGGRGGARSGLRDGSGAGRGGMMRGTTSGQA